MEHCEGVTCPMLFLPGVLHIRLLRIVFCVFPVPVTLTQRPQPGRWHCDEYVIPCRFLVQPGCRSEDYIRGGFAHFAPVCSTWVWVSRHSTSRSYIHPLGRPGQQIVGEANIMVARVVLLTALLMGRGVWVTIEQPVSSLMRSRVCPSQQGTRPPLVPP